MKLFKPLFAILLLLSSIVQAQNTLEVIPSNSSSTMSIYGAQPRNDTVQVKILIDDHKGIVPRFVFGWLVRQYNLVETNNTVYAFSAMQWLPFSTGIFLAKNKVERIDNDLIWDYKIRKW